MQIKINKRSVYGPIRYEATRPYAQPIGKAFVAAAKKGEQARLAFVGQLLPMLKTAVKRIGSESGPGPVQAEIGNVQVFGEYLEGGKVIFDMSKALTQTLLYTDAEDIPCSELVFPASSFYIHFGGDAGLVDGGINIEGIFVARIHDRMVFDLVPQGFGQEHFLSLPMGDRLIGAFLMLDKPSMTISQALRESIDEVLSRNASILEQIREVERQLEAQYGEVVRVPLPEEDLSEKRALMQKVLGLVVNAMFYLSAEPEDVVTDWGRDTPSQAVDALGRASKPGEIRTLENTLLKAGYSKVRFVGRRFSQSVAAQQIQEAGASGRTLAVHFRRGHFRRQPYGPERALRKTIFVAPVVVNAGSGDEPQGRIFVL